jgi:hypothetical protein
MNWCLLLLTYERSPNDECGLLKITLLYILVDTISISEEHDASVFSTEERRLHDADHEDCRVRYVGSSDCCVSSSFSPAI